MISVILDSSNKALCVALAKDDKIIEEVCYEAWQRQSELMIPELDNLLKKHNVVKEEIDEIIVSVGPGSYTGIRVALTIAKIMGYCLKCKVYKISSLEGLKVKGKKCICLLNARSERSYIGVYDGNNVILKDQIMENNEVLKYVASHDDFVVCGDTKYLEIEGEKSNLAESLLMSKRDECLVEDILALKPVYLKD